MSKKKTFFIPLLAIIVVVFVGYKGFGWENEVQEILSQLRLGVAETSGETVEAWQIVAEYKEYARTHNLEGIKKLSHAISPTCADASKETECFALMDSVYNILNQFKLEQFKNIVSDDYRITLFTDYADGVRAAIYFTRDVENTLKISGMKFCFGDAATPDQCSSLQALTS